MVAPGNNIPQQPITRPPSIFLWSAVKEAVGKLAARHAVDVKPYGMGIGGHLVAVMWASIIDAGLPLDRPPEEGEDKRGVVIVTDWLDQTGNKLYLWQRAGFVVDAVWRHKMAPPGLAPKAIVLLGDAMPPWMVQFAPKVPQILTPGGIALPPGRPIS